MKKTTLALLASAFVANSASAITVFDSEETGTKVEFTGSARLQWRSEANKTSNVNGATTRKHENKAVSNNGSRFGFKVNQQLGAGFYALGRVEWRFQDHNLARSQHDFDHVHDRQLYAGIGHKQYGELTYGHMTTVTDEVKQTDLPNTLSLSDGLLTANARHAIQYTYQGIDGLKLGAFYSGHSQRGSNGLDLTNHVKDVWGAAAIYKHKIDELQSVKTGIGFTRDRFEQSGLSAYDRNAFSFGAAYTYDKTTIGVDLERRETNDQRVVENAGKANEVNRGALGNKRTEKEIRTVLFHKITDDWRAYTMYAYKDNKLDSVVAGKDTKVRRHQFMLGTEYYIVPKYLKAFVEWQTTHAKHFENGEKTKRVRDNITVIGARAYW